jgi:hypothetical protein
MRIRLCPDNTSQPASFETSRDLLGARGQNDTYPPFGKPPDDLRADASVRAGYQHVLINGAAGLVALRDGQPSSVGAFTIWGGKIVELNILADPERLRRVGLQKRRDGSCRAPMVSWISPPRTSRRRTFVPGMAPESNPGSGG